MSATRDTFAACCGKVALVPTPRKIIYRELPAELEAVRHVRLDQVLQLVPVGERTWLRGVADGRYPRGVKLGPGVTAWSLAAIRRLLEEGVAGA